MNQGLVLIIVGGIIVLLSHPKIRAPLIARMYNEGLVVPKVVKPEKAEVIKYAGPNLSLFAIGVILILIGIVIAV